MSAQTSLVSVIVPTHNRADLLARALASALGQTYARLEVIVVENACTDRTSATLDAIDDARLRRLQLPSKCGASAARNAGLELAKGAFVAFLDDDDFWFPHKLERQLRTLHDAGPSVGLCLCGYLRLFPDRVVPYFSREYFEQIDFSYGVALRNFAVIATPGWLVRRETLDAAGRFDEQMPARNDWEFALRLRDVCEFAYVAEPLYCQDQTRQTTMAFDDRKLVAALRRIEAVHGHRWDEHPEIRAAHARIIGRYELSRGNDAEGRQWLRRALRYEPGRLRTLALFLAACTWPGALRSVERRYQQAWHRRQGNYR